MSFTHPIYLLLFIPVAIGLFLSYRHVGGMARSRKRFAFILRSLLAACIVLALAGPESKRMNEGMCTIFLLDRSDSITDVDKKSQIEFVNQALKNLGPKDLATVIAFGKEPVAETLTAKIDRIDRVQSIVDGTASDMASAVRLASATFPDGKSKRIVLISDGNETTGDLTEAGSVAATEGIPIDHVVMGSTPQGGEVAISNVELPSESRVDQPFSAKVTIDSNTAGSATLYLDRNGVKVKEMKINLEPGKNNYVIADTLKDTGFHRYRVTLKTDHDRDHRNNVGMGFISVKGKPRILVAQQDKNRTELRNALEKQGLAVDLVLPSGLPTRPEEYQNYDAIVFNDLNAEFVHPRVQQTIQSAVRDSGIGFAMIGGENSFLSGGWYGTPIAEALPVDLNIRQRKSFPSTTILIVSDTSGSMGMIEDGQPKVRLAAKAAEQTVMMMAPVDKVGVVASTDGIKFVSPIQKLTNKELVISQIRTLGVGGGGIYMKPSMEFAQKYLVPDDSKVRHLIVLADGSDCDLQEGCIPIALAMRAQKITTTCVAIGDGPHVPFLKSLAAAGGGRFYLAEKASQLPAIFTQDAATMSRSAIEEGAFMPKIAIGEEILRGIDTDSMPPLLAYCLTDTRPLTRVGMRTKKDEPLLATWQYGLGSTLAFTSDAQARWAAQWINWGGFGQFWAQAIRSISRRASSTTYQIATNQTGAKGEVTILARDANGNPVNTPPKEARISTPSGEFKPLAITQTGPGEFKGTFTASEVGTYIATVAEDSAAGPRVTSSGFSIAYPPEYKSYRPNQPLLTQVSEMTKGMAVTDPRQAVRMVPEPGYSIQELWALFVILAAILLPLDIACRRIALPFNEILAKGIEWLRNRRRAEVPTHVDQLRKAKERAGVTPGQAPAAPVHIESGGPGEAAVAPRPKTAAGATSSALLDAKRKRKSEE